MGGNVLGTGGGCSAWADPAQPLGIFSTHCVYHSFLESYLWITTKLPPAFPGKSCEGQAAGGSHWEAAFQAWSDGLALS